METIQKPVSQEKMRFYIFIVQSTLYILLPMNAQSNVAEYRPLEYMVTGHDLAIS